jgi:PAS domain S-box-containing protein
MSKDARIADLERRLAASEADLGEATSALRSAEKAAVASEERLRQALEAGRMEHWVWDSASNTVTRSNSIPHLSTLVTESGTHTGVERLALVHPDDRERHARMVAQAGRNGKGWHTEVRFIEPDSGEIYWFEERAAPATDPETGELRIVGFLWDITERKRAEEALRESEERFQQFGNASAGAIWIRDAATLNMEYVSPAISTIYGVEPETVLGSIERWIDLIVPKDRDDALEHIERARGGESVVHEFRIQRPTDQAIRWIRDTDFPLLDAHGRVQRIGGIAEDVTEAKRAAHNERLLLAELQHRVRNIFAIVRSIYSRTVEAGGPLEEITDHFRGRLDSLARTQTVVTQSPTGDVDLQNLIREELLSVGVSDSPSLIIKGPDIALPPAEAESIGLAIHELTTNALKYGALKVPGATLEISWKANIDYGEIGRLDFSWTEQGVPAISVQPARQGFGTELITEALPYRLGAETSLQFRGGGVRCTISLPLPVEGASAVPSWKDF